MSEGGEKTEEPTHQKLDKARKEGQVWKSRDFSGVFAFGAAMGVVKASWDGVETGIKQLFFFAIEHTAHPDDLRLATEQLMLLGWRLVLVVCVPVAFAAAVMGGLMEFLQVGPLLAVKALMPKMEKLNPISGIKNMFSKKQVVELLKSLFKLGVTAYVVYGVVRDAMGIVVATIHGDAAITMTVLGELVFRVVTRVSLLLVAFAIFDIWWQHKSYMKDQMMSKDEVKKEYKESEGDPHQKAKRKEFAMELLEGAQMEAVKGADVIVTNPDHVAVALKYDKARDNAPRLLAKGIDARAATIRELAKQYDVPLLRNVPLAHALLRVDVNDEVPEALYDAVAEVLNFVYSLKEGQPAKVA